MGMTPTEWPGLVFLCVLAVSYAVSMSVGAASAPHVRQFGRYRLNPHRLPM